MADGRERNVLGALKSRIRDAISMDRTWFTGVLVRLFSWIGLTVLAVAGIALINADRISTYIWPTYGQIFLSTPQVYTRERLVEDRYIQDAWIRERLRPRVSETGAATLADEGAEGNTKEKGTQRSTETTLGASATAVLDEELAVRDKLRALLRENRLDDRHDIEGSTLYLLKFALTVTPGERTRAVARVTVHVESESGEASQQGEGEALVNGRAAEEKASKYGVLLPAAENRLGLLAAASLSRWQEQVNARIESVRKEKVLALEEEELSDIQRSALAKIIVLTDADYNRCFRYWNEALNPLSNAAGFKDLESAWRRFALNLGDGLGDKTQPAQSVPSAPPDLKAVIRDTYSSKYKTSVSSEELDNYVTAYINCASIIYVLSEVFEVSQPWDAQVAQRIALTKYFRFVVELSSSSQPFQIKEYIEKLVPIDPTRDKSRRSSRNDNAKTPIPYCGEGKGSEAWEDRGKAVDMCRGIEQPSAVPINIMAEDGVEKNFCVKRDTTGILERFLKEQAENFGELGGDPVSTVLSDIHDDLSVSRGPSVQTVKNIPQWWCEWETDFFVGRYNFHQDISRFERVFTYAVYPRNVSRQVAFRDQRRFSLTDVVDVSRGAVVQGTTSEGALISFIDARSEASDGEEPTDAMTPDRPKKAVFGWLIYPTRDGSGQFRQQAATHDVSALVSVPAWMRELTITVRTEWLGGDGKPIDVGYTKHSYKINVPGDIDEVLRIADPARERRIALDRQERERGISVVACNSASILITGRRLWRGAVVTLGSQVADEIRVLPDMQGIVATFYKVHLPGRVGASGSKQTAQYEVPVRIWTSEGSAEVSASAEVVMPENPTNCAATPQ